LWHPDRWQRCWPRMRNLKLSNGLAHVNGLYLCR
jgi:hypothetical protein